MDSEIEILHYVGIDSLKSQECVQVNISSQFNKLIPPQNKSFSKDPIETIWNRRTSENPKLYNGTKFRVHSIHNSDEDQDKVEINVGVTDYKSFLGTNWAENIEELQLQGKLLHHNTQAFLSDALGVGAFLELSDNYIVLLKRNAHCAEAPNLWDVPGGHAEPKNIVGDIPLEKIDVSMMTSEKVRKEIFDSIIQEVTDEVNIPIANLERPLYIGTAKNMTSGGRPSLEFFIKCSMTSQNVYINYCKGSQLEADESTSIKFVPVDEIGNLQKSNEELWNNLAPSAKGNIILYQMVHGLYQE